MPSSKYVTRRMVETVSRIRPLGRLVQGAIAATRYRDEMALLRGKDRELSDSPSVLFFTTQRCASRFVRSLLQRLAPEANVVYADVEGLLFTVGEWTDAPEGFYALDGLNKEEVFKSSGYVYGPIRAYIPGIPDIRNYKIILMLRDPRDVLTSWYSTIAHKHLIPYYNPPVAEVLLNVRRKALEHSIDEFVLLEASHWRNIYHTYCTELLNQPNVLYTKFEDMTNYFPSWLHQVTSFLHWEIQQETARQIIDSAVRRRVAPGRYRSELTEETIQRLNREFRDILEKLDYQ